MEGASLAAQAVASDPPGAAPGQKGLKTNAIGFVSSVVIGVASTAPGYSLAAVLGLIVAIEGVGVQAPAVMIAAFVPMLFVATAYRYINRADPDCGTTFSWSTRAFGPVGRLDRRLGDHRRRHHRHGEPRADRRPLHASCSSTSTTRRRSR